VTRSKHRHASSGRRLPAAVPIGLGLALALSLAGGHGGSPAGAQEEGRLGAILQGLDKTTARVSTIEAPLDRPARFGTLQIIARACHKKPPTETPESTAFLEIVDVRPDSPSIPVFTGWMFASSPAISAMEHPVYDIWVIDCRMIALPEVPEIGAAGGDGEAPEAPEGPEAPEAGEAPEAPDLGLPQSE